MPERPDIHYFTNAPFIESSHVVYHKLPVLSGIVFIDLWRILLFVETFKNKFGLISKDTSIIAIDNYCLMLAALVKLFIHRRVTILYLSFEVYWTAEIKRGTSFYLLRTRYWCCLLEKLLITKSDYVLIQDKQRLEILERGIGQKLPTGKIIFLPLSIVKRNLNVSEGSSPYQAPSGYVSVIYSGSYLDWTNLNSYLDYIEANPNIQIHTVFHSRANKHDVDIKHREIFKRIIEMSETDKYPITYIIDYIEDMDDYIGFLKQFDLGLVSYANNLDNGQNMKYVGLASSKFCLFASIGMPMIAYWRDDIITDIFREYPFGYCTSNMLEIGRITKKQFESDVSMYKRNVNRLYDEMLNPSDALMRVGKIVRGAEHKIGEANGQV